MAKISRQIIDKILDAARIEEVVGDILGKYDSDNRQGLKKTGVRYKALCPFHADRTMGSFIVYPKGNCYKCFSCGEAGGVVDFVMKHERLSYPDAIRWLGKKYNIETDMQDFNYTPPPPRPAPPPLEMLVLPKHIMAGTLVETALAKDNLVQYIRTSINWDAIQRKRMEQMLSDYPIGHGRNGHTIFWQIDEQGRLRTGKMMKYYPKEDPRFGHRDKDSSWNFDYIHATLSRHWDEERKEMVTEPPYPYPDLFDPDKQEPTLTYFGMNLLDKYKRKDVEQTVCIVESEKTALLMAIAYGNHTKQVWMACGGIEMLNRDRLQPIIDQRRRIMLYPDRDGIEKWKVKAEQLHYDRLAIDTRPVTEWWKPEDGPKADIADVVVRAINENGPMTKIDEVKAAMPETTPLIDKLNLTIDNSNEQEDNDR